MSDGGETPTRPDDPYADPLAVAIIDLIVERGWKGTEVADVIARAGVTEEEFYRRFRGKEDCARRSFEAFTADYEWRIEQAYRSQPDWRSGLRAAAYEVADWMLEHPNTVRFGAVEALEAKSEMIRVHREEAMSYGAKVIDRGRAAAPDPEAVPASAAMIAIGSIVQLLAHRLQSGIDPDPHTMVPQMMYLAIRPYVGEDTAREELTLPRPELRQRDT